MTAADGEEPRHRGAERRPIASRNLRVMQRIADALIARRISANAISLSCIGFALFAAICLALTGLTSGLPARTLLVLGALGAQARLLANLLDGMVAVGSGKASAVGELYNDVPDRVADVLILIGAGLGAGGSPLLGCTAAILAVFVAYVRVLGNSLGVRDLFIGPMAKQQRMATLTVACAYLAFAPGDWPFALDDESVGALAIALAGISIGIVITAVRRLHRIAAQLQDRA